MKFLILLLIFYAELCTVDELKYSKAIGQSVQVRRRLSRPETSSIHSEVWLRKCKCMQCCKGKVQLSQVAVTNTEEHGSVSPRNAKRNINMLQGMAWNANAQVSNEYRF